MEMRMRMRVCVTAKGVWLGQDADVFLVGERRRLADAVKHHTRDRNRPPSEPAGKFVFVLIYLAC